MTKRYGKQWRDPSQVGGAQQKRVKLVQKKAKKKVFKPEPPTSMQPFEALSVNHRDPPPGEDNNLLTDQEAEFSSVDITEAVGEDFDPSSIDEIEI